MCFSAPVSFGAAAILGATGVVTLTRVRKLADLPLAAVPLVFALQQGLEGALWFTVPEGRAHSVVFANLFAAIALIVWPLLSPAAAALVERELPRRLVMLTLLPAGIGVALYSAGTMVAHPYLAWPKGHALTYVNNQPFSPTMIVTYMVCTCLPPLLSSSRMLRTFGIVVAVGLAVAMAAFFEDFFSVWCFFAALASLLVLGFFRDRARTPSVVAIEAMRPTMSD
jgi:hypothetical protein